MAPDLLLHTVASAATTDSIPPGNGIIASTFGIAVIASFAYSAGRIHQWYRTALERHQAWRDGYDQATQSLFRIATRRKAAAHDDDSGEVASVSPLARPGREPGLTRQDLARWERTAGKLLRKAGHPSRTPGDDTTVIIPLTVSHGSSRGIPEPHGPGFPGSSTAALSR